MSYIYFIIQVVFIILIGITGPIIPQSLPVLAGAAIGVLGMIWALWAMRLSNLNMIPDSKHKSIFVTSGPYKIVRHPMYASVLLVTLMLVINDFTLLRIIFWLVLLIDLHFKFLYEEKILLKKYSEYADYKNNTKRLIPFIY